MKKWQRSILSSMMCLSFLLSPVNFQSHPVVQAQSSAAITNASELEAIRADLTGSYVLTADIDLSTVLNWTPLGDGTTPFTGSLDGGGFAIRNLTVSNTQSPYQGLFGVIGSGGSVSNLRIEDARITAADTAGILAGENRGTIDRASAQGIISGATNVGGLVGTNTGTITNTFAIASVSGANNNGGLVGNNTATGVIQTSYSASSVSGAVTNNYIQFDGVNDYIRIPHNDAYVTGSFTLEAWFQWVVDTHDGDTPTDTRFITSKGTENYDIHTGGGSGNYGIRFIPVDKDDTTFADGLNDARAYQDVHNMLKPGWNHVAAVWDFDHQQVQVLLNGIPQDIYQMTSNVGTTASLPLINYGTAETPIYHNPLETNTKDFYIGARNEPVGTPSLFFKGYIADVRFWNRVRSAAEIAADKDKQLTGNEQGLIGYWKLNEASGATVIDSSSQGNDGTIIGATRIKLTGSNGGLVASNAGTVENCYYDQGLFSTGSPVTGVTPRDTADMKKQSMYSGFTFGAGGWKIIEDNTYPTLFTHSVPVTITSVSPSPSVSGQEITVSFSVPNHYLGAPQGNVTVSDGSGGTCSGSLTPGSPNSGSCAFASSGAGEKTLTAAYPGNSVFTGVSGTESHTVNQADSATTIESDLADPSVVGQPYTVNVRVAAVSPGSGTPSGSVEVKDGLTGASCSIELSSGTGSCELTSTTAGSKELTATFSGDTNFKASSDTEAHVVSQASTTTTITSQSLEASVVGQAYTVNVNVAAVAPGSGAPTGSVEVSDGSGATCPITTLTGGNGSCPLISTTTGDKALTATYAGNANYTTSSTSSSTPHTVSKADTTTTITSESPDTSVTGQGYTVNVSVAAAAPGGGTPGGTVTVKDSPSGASCTAELSSGAGSCQLTSTTAGSKTLSAEYGGDSGFNPSTDSDGEAHGVNPADTTTTIAISGDTSVIGEAYTVSVTVTAAAPGSGLPTGTVEVKDSPTGEPCTITLENGTGSCDLTSTSLGTKTISASYSGDLNFKASNNTETHSVDQFQTTTTITSISAEPSVVGQTYTVNVSVAATSPGSGTPTGTVSISDGIGLPKQITLTNGTGSGTLATTQSGTMTITAIYSGDTNALGSTDTTTHTVNQAQTQVTVTGHSPNPSVVDETVTFWVTVAVTAPGAGTPTGTVDILEDTTLLCSGTLSSGQASCTYADLPLGAHTLTARYNGDSNFAGATNSFSHSVQSIGLDDNQTSTHFTSIGKFSTAGGASPYTYRLQTSGSLCTTANGADNARFSVNGDTLERLEGTGSGTYSICVESEDASGGVMQKTFSILINDPPALDGSSLSRLTVGSDGTEVGTLTVTGGHAPFTFSLANSGSVCTPVNSTGNASFDFSSATLTRNSSTPVGEYKVCLQAEDAEGDTAQYTYSITVSGGPEALALSRTRVSTAQSVVGDFSEQGGIAPFSYSLQTSGSVCNSTNGAGNGSFTANGSQLERQASTPSGGYDICAQVEDANGMTYQAAFTITVSDPPSQLDLSNQTVSDSQELVGTLSTTSGLFPYTYSLQSSGSVCQESHAVQNALFRVEGNGLKRLSAATPGSYTICLQTSDDNGAVYQKAFTITVTDSPEPPTAWTVVLTSNQVIDNDPLGTVVGSLVSSIDGTSYALVDTGAFPLASYFAINPGGQLILTGTLSLLSQDNLPIRIRATAPNGQVKDLDVVITVMKSGTSAGGSAQNDSGMLSQDSTLRIDPTANDQMSTGATTWDSTQIVRYPEHGTAQVGSIIYTPDPGFFGTDTVTYRACDNLGYCVLGTATFSVSQAPDSGASTTDSVLKAKMLPKTGFAPFTITPIGDQPTGEHYFTLANSEIRLEIPSLGVDIPVVGVPFADRGWNTDWLQNEAGWLQGTAFPGWNGNSALAAHVTGSNGLAGPFARLSQLRWGDKIIVRIHGVRHTYEVRESSLDLSPSDTSVLRHEKLPWLTLITCDDYDVKTDSYHSRTVVRAVLIEVK